MGEVLGSWYGWVSMWCVLTGFVEEGAGLAKGFVFLFILSSFGVEMVK